MTTEEKLLLLRIQLYTAAQTLKGQDLADLKQLITEIAKVIDFESTAAPRAT